MRMYLISDNNDTYIGMRMAGIEGVVVHEADEVEQALGQAAQDPEIGLVLITAKLVELCRETVYQYKLGNSGLLIVEVPDRHGQGGISDAITRYVREAVGIKL